MQLVAATTSQLALLQPHQATCCCWLSTPVPLCVRTSSKSLLLEICSLVMPCRVPRGQLSFHL